MGRLLLSNNRLTLRLKSDRTVFSYRIAGILALCVGFAQSAALGQSFSDMLQDSQLLTGTSVFISGSNSNATVEPFEPLHAGKVGGHSVWISWVAPDHGLLSLSTAGSSFDTLLGVYILRPGASSPMKRLREVAANDDDEATRSFTSAVSFGVNSNETYLIAVDGFNGATGSIIFRLNFLSSSSLQPTVLRRPGDRSLRLGDPLILSVGIVRLGDMNLIWYLNGNPITDDSASPTLVIPSLQRTNLGDYSVALLLNDDTFFSTPTEVEVNSEGQSGVLARYKVADAGQSGLIGNNGLTLGYNGTQIFNTTNSILDTNAPSICGATGGAPYWFAYQAPTNGTMTVNTTGSSFNTLLGVFTYFGTFTNDSQLFSVACDITNGPNGLPSEVQFDTVTAQNYFIVVDGVNGARGIAHLNYSLRPGGPLQAPIITSGPESLTVAKQTAVALSVMAGGSAPLAYQWRLNNSPMNHQTNATLLLNSPKTQDSGIYTVVVTNAGGAVTSAPATINVINGPMAVTDTNLNRLVSAFPATRGYQYSADCCVSGALGSWYPWTNAFPDYGGVIWLTNTMENDALFLRVHSP